MALVLSLGVGLIASPPAWAAARVVGAEAARFAAPSAHPAGYWEPAPDIDINRTVDVDGDGHKDAVNVQLYDLTRPDDPVVVVRVATARSQTARVTLHVEAVWAGGIVGYGGTPLRGTAQLDGDKGAELLVDTADNRLSVLHWRSGRLVAESLAAPFDGHTRASTRWPISGDLDQNSYRLFTSKKVRYVDAAQLVCGDCFGPAGTYEKVMIVRSRWKAHAWRRVKVIVRKRLSRAQAAPYFTPFRGLKLSK